MLNNFFNTNYQSLLWLLGTFIVLLIAYFMLLQVLRKLGKNPKYLIPSSTVKTVSTPIFLILVSILLRMASLRQILGLSHLEFYFRKTSTLLFIFAFTWLIIKAIKIVKQHVMHTYDMNTSDNLRARKVATQFNILERIVIFIIIILAVGIALMSFDGIREIGVSIFASAGVAGIIIGFSAQKMIGTILAGIQIALAQPIKLDDVVVVEGEWGRIEEIMLTYVVVKIWDKRRLILPTTYFIEKPFQNWTKSSADILGTVFLYTDYSVPFEALRKELTRILKNTDLWDGEVNNIQVTDSKANHIEIRALMSAVDSSTAWDLRVHVRENLITFLQENYPESLPRTRLRLENMEAPENTTRE
ncbi:mechanosensitive ion channel family protein [Zobellia russellii]|uniref:mechanosensitive ion channel family protein n=1 Tax=Zobellia russellii TaxID=248907 RepID=UPI001BFF72F1|nr:mechanosensitive ion channel domain-containing protein [Zobellia russellii]MBT9186847.1 mechanosensitive ion channel [Zobellia russellii]